MLVGRFCKLSISRFQCQFCKCDFRFPLTKSSSCIPCNRKSFDEVRLWLAPTRRKIQGNVIQWTVISVGGCIITVQLYYYNNPAQVEQDPNTIARDQQLRSLVQCMLIFREIGLDLQDGRMPDGTMICGDSPALNVVRNEDGVLHIYHPNPQYYGYKEISVSNEVPEPSIIRIQP
jgi:hypothetical protein